MAANINKLERLYQKECELVEKHKNQAEDYKRQLEEARGNAIRQAVNRQNLSGSEFEQLMTLLKSRKTISDALKTVKQEGEAVSNET